MLGLPVLGVKLKRVGILVIFHDGLVCSAI